MRRPRFVPRVLAPLAAALVAALALAGCGDAPLGPSAPALGSAGSSAPAILVVGADGSVSYLTAPTEAEFLAAGRTPGAAPNRSLSTVAVVDGSVGGKLACGRFVVTVPPGAFIGTGTISMCMPDTAQAVLDLTISPRELNSFKVPVQLSYDPRGLSLTNPVTILYLDAKTWVDLGARPQAGTGLPTADLAHFSKYAAGKAGW